MNMEFWMSLMQIMIVNIVLSGDNAVVIAMAARGLPENQQKAAILWGSGGAVVLRVILTVVAVALLKVPFLQFVGGLMLVWIAYQLLVEADEPVGEDPNGKHGLMAAVKTILVADVVMSLDNTLAIAGVAKGNYTLLGLGLALSIPLVVFGSALIMKAMDKFPVLVYIGAGLIAYTAGEMIDGDKALQPYMPHCAPPHAVSGDPHHRRGDRHRALVQPAGRTQRPRCARGRRTCRRADEQQTRLTPSPGGLRA